MAFRFDSLTRRTCGPLLACALVGTVVGVVGASLATQETFEPAPEVSTDQALFNDPDYGAR